MGRLEKQIIIGALALVGVLLTVVVLKGLQPRDDSSVDLGGVSEWERPVTPKLDAFGAAGSSSLSLEAEFQDAGGDPAEVVTPQPASTPPAPQPEPVAETPAVPGERPVDDGPREYIVKKDEVLSLIAQRELGSVRHLSRILELNPEIHPSGDNISEGQVLLLPSLASLEPKRDAPPPQRPAELVGVRTHVVTSGDSLWALSVKYYGSGAHVDRIVAANDKVPNENATLMLGWTLIIPE